VTGRPRPATTPAVRSRATAVLAEIAALGSETDRAGMARYGINVDDAYGVSVTVLRRMAKGLGHDHELALELWRTGNHEARLLAAFVDEPDKVDERQMESWAADLDSWDLCDEVTTDLFDRTRFAWGQAVAWAGRPEEFVKRAGFALMAGLAAHDKAAGHEAFVALLGLVEREAFDERNFVKKAVNWALRNIGKRSLDLNAEAVACARRLRDAADERAGGPRGGDAATRAARWVASDALRELQSPKTQERLIRRGA
jgi:3-methyladenine DNA glycosylase AlkD